MNGWQFLDKQIGRLPGWPDGRGLVGVATFALTVGLLVMYRNDPSLRDDDFFKTIATAVVITGFVNAIIGWAFGDTAKSVAATDNTGKFADAMTEMARNQNPAGDERVIREGDVVELNKGESRGPVDSGG